VQEEEEKEEEEKEEGCSGIGEDGCMRRIGAGAQEDGCRASQGLVRLG